MIRFLVPKIGSRYSDCQILRFRFCGENVGRSFVVCSDNPILRTNKESSIWRQNDHRDIMQNLSAPFIFQEDCRMEIEHVVFPSVSFQITDPCIERSFSISGGGGGVSESMDRRGCAILALELVPKNLIFA